MTFGEIGYFLSHHTIWERMVSEKLQEVLILEDDVDFEPNFCDDLEQIECPLMSGALGAHGVSVVARVEEESRPGQERASEVISVQAVALSQETAAWNSVLLIAAVPSWGPWSEWSGCSHTCGGGNRLRLRSCLDGDFCEGNSTDYEECNTQECPSKWGEWSIWSECSKSCDEGVRYRRRECLPGLHCTGPVKEEEPCNVNITCGVRHIGCYRLSHSRLKMYEKMTRDLSDSPTSRTEPVRKCDTASLDQGNTYFSLGEGICFSGSNQISDYIGGGESQSCSGGRGNYFGGQFVIDVYHIDDAIAFQDSSTACVACGKDYCSEPDLQSNWRLMCSVSSTHHILPTVSVILFLVLCLLLL